MKININNRGRLLFKSGDAVEHYQKVEKLVLGKPVESLDDKLKEDKKNEIKKIITIRGLTFAIENNKGNVRKGMDDNGEEWRIKLFYDYGFIVGSVGADGEEVDAYLGPDKESDKVFIIHQKNPENGKYDEDKCMIFFSDWNHARDSYLAHYSDQNFLGDHTEMDFDTFKEKVFKTQKKPGMIKSLIINIRKSLDGRELDEFNGKHPRDEDGKFKNKLTGDELKTAYEKFSKEIVGIYTTPIPGLKINIRKGDFRKFFGFTNPIGREKFEELAGSGKLNWQDLNYEDLERPELIPFLQEVITNPDEIRKVKNTTHKLVAGDYIFSKRKNKEQIHIIVSDGDLVKTGGLFSQNFIGRYGGEIIYIKRKGLVKSLSPQKSAPLCDSPVGANLNSNLMNFGFIVNENIEDHPNRKRLLWKSQMNLFGDEGNSHKQKLNMFNQQQHEGDTRPGKHGTLIIKKNPSGHGAHLEYLAKNDEQKTGKVKDETRQMDAGQAEEIETLIQKYNSAEEFVKEFNKISGKNTQHAFGDSAKNKLTPEEKKLHDVVLKYLQSSQVEKLYTQGQKDDEILTDFYNQIKKVDEEIKPGVVKEIDGVKKKLNENYQWEVVGEKKAEPSFKFGSLEKDKEMLAAAEKRLTEAQSSVERITNPKLKAEKEKEISNINQLIEKLRLSTGTVITSKTASVTTKSAETPKAVIDKEVAADKNVVKESDNEDISTKIKNRLDEKQKGKEFKDVNERVPMSKKEKAAFRTLTLADLNKLDEASAYTIVTKDRLIPDLDITKLREEGEQSGTVWFKKKLRDLVAQKPENNDNARKIFVDRLPKYFEEIDKAKNIEDIINSFREKISVHRRSWRSEVRTFRLKDEAEFRDLPLEDVFGKAFCNFVTMTNDTAREQIGNAKLMNKFTEDEAKKSYQDASDKTAEFKKKRKEKEDAFTDETWAGELMSEAINDFPYMKEMGLSYKEVSKAKKEDPEKYKEMLEKFKQYRKDRLENAKAAYSNYDEFVNRSPKNKPRENDWSWMDNSGKKEREVSTDLKIHDNPPLAYIKRENGREVTAAEVSPDTITKEFGFKSVQLGNYVKDVEAREHIKHFVASMKDLEDALGIDLKKLNEEGGLSIAFGARGGSGALAHYEPTFKIINLTKKQGDGTIAHEWCHFFDHFLGGGDLNGIAKNEIFATHKSANADDEISIAVKNVVEAMHKGFGSIKKTFEPRADKSYINGLESLYKNQGMDAAVNYIRTRIRENSQDHAFEILARIHGKPIEIEIPKKKTDFLEGAQSFKSEYWQRPLEMFARAGESYIQDKLAEMGMYNNYLVNGNNLETPDHKWGVESLARVYPQGEERKKINEAFDKLFEVFRKKGYAIVDKGEKRVGEFVDLQKSLDAEILDMGTNEIELEESFVW